MSDPNAMLSVAMEQFKDQFNTLDRSVRSSIDRIREVVYRNKKTLEGGIYRNKISVEGMQKRLRWMWLLVGVQTVLATWLLVTALQLQKDVDVLSQTVRAFENQTLKDLSRVQVEVESIQNSRDRQDVLREQRKMMKR